MAASAAKYAERSAQQPQTRSLSLHEGKKSVIASTDGGDNAGFLSADIAIGRARRAGLPVCMVAEGDDLTSSTLMEQLRRSSRQTGAATFEVGRPPEIDKVFRKIIQELQHTYMLAYAAPPDHDAGRRAIRLIVTGVKHIKIHSKEGYDPR